MAAALRVADVLRSCWEAYNRANALPPHVVKAVGHILRCRTAALGGGCFFNRILRERTVQRLQAAGLRVCQPGDKGCGDAGLAIGQAWVAAQQLQTPQTTSPVEETTPCA